LADKVTRTTVLAKGLRNSDCSNLPVNRVSRSLSDLRQETLVSMSGRTCHHCHAPQSDPEHVGIPTGVGHCTLEHWEHCKLQQPEGYDKHKKLWTGCPGLNDSAEESDEEVDITIDKTGVAAGKTDALVDDSDEDTEDEENRLALQELEELKKRVELNQKQIDADKALAVKMARKEKKQAARLKIEQQRADLLLAEKIMLKEKASLSRMTKAVPVNSTNGLSHSASILNSNNSGAQFQPSGVLKTGLSAANGGLSVDTGYVYVAKLGRLVPTVPSLASVAGPGILSKQQYNPEQSRSDFEVSAEDDCPASPSPGYRLAWRKDGNGIKYCEEVKLPEKSPEILTAWVKRSDGRIYKEQITRDCSERSGRTASSRGVTLTPAMTTAPKSSRTQSFVDHRVPEEQGRAVERGYPRREDRQPSFIPAEERPGKDAAVPKLVKRARLCPVAWTEKITSDQLNPIIWSWAFIADILAARTGQAPDLEAGELEARLQHFLNVLEVTLQTSGKTDYMGDSWKVARLYHTKVQAKVDQGTTSWCKMVDRWDSATLPHELMAAQQELAPRQTRNKQRDPERLKDADDRVLRCGYWNTWETEGICKWESENHGEKCNRLQVYLLPD
jgi:hypothetical protein